MKLMERTRGIVMRARLLSETSLILDWITEDHGRLSTVAKGARRAKSPFRGKLDLYYLVDLGFRRSQKTSLHLLQEAVLSQPRLAYPRTVAHLQHAAYTGSLIERATEREAPIPAIFALFHDFLRHLVEQSPRPVHVITFELKLLHELGQLPLAEEAGLPPAARDWVKQVVRSDWPKLTPLLDDPPSLHPLASFLAHYLKEHYGPLPAQRQKTLA